MSLHLLPPQPSPSRSLETMPIGRIRKTAFHQMSPSSSIASGRRTGRLRPQPVHFDLPIQSLHPPSMLGVGALDTQWTLGALCRRRFRGCRAGIPERHYG